MGKKKLGIIGGGQLALMLLEAGKKLDLSVRVLASQHEPAIQFADKTNLCQDISEDYLIELLSDSDFATIESEFVNIDLLEKALKKISSDLVFLPLPESIKISQDKLSQKYLFQKHHLPTADFSEITPSQTQNLPLNKMLKWAKFGYDGKGNFLYNDSRKQALALNFCQEGYSKGGRIYAEELISFESELAMVFVREKNGKLHNYPLVISEQENNICKLVRGPATKLGVSSSVEKDAIEIGYILASKLDLYGTFAIEFFYTNDKRLLINEMAPRVHNSGHFTLNCAKTSQFENHIRAVTGMPIGSTETSSYFAMLNLIGPNHMTKDLPSDLQIPTQANLHAYWYRKTTLKPGRKMGHINFCTNNVDSLHEGILQLKSYDQKLWNLI